jgi:hypothetical protein
VVGSCEHGNEPSGSIKGRKFNYLSDCKLLKEILLQVFSQSVSCFPQMLPCLRCPTAVTYTLN